jgi:AAA15 family ATPase/GTPase
MLLDFCVENFRSFRDKQIISLIKAKGNELEENNTFHCETKGGGFELLRSAVIYGPNAGGKSNFLRALLAMRQIILHSVEDQHVLEKTIVPFRLDSASSNRATVFSVNFITDDVHYQYGFEATNKKIQKEWLNAYPKCARSRRWFYREWNNAKQQYDWDVKIKGEKKTWQESTRENALFLTTATQLNCKQLLPIQNWFKALIIATGFIGQPLTKQKCESSEKSKILDFLRAADFGIKDIEIEETPFDPKVLPELMPHELKEFIIKETKDQPIVKIKMIHSTKEGEKITFEFNDESLGTQQFFSLAGPFIEILTKGGIVFYDELERSLHPTLLEFIIKCFHSNRLNKHNAQIVFTTHQISLLGAGIFRRDQIWFCKRNKDFASSLFPLSDFPTRKEENFERAYLNDLYGALPFIGTLDLGE